MASSFSKVPHVSRETTIGQTDALIVVYGPLSCASGPVSASTVLQSLFDRSMWFFSARSRYLVPNTPLLFYETRRGITAIGRVGTVENVGQGDTAFLNSWGISNYKIKISLKKTRVLPAVISMLPIIDQLDFIRNKRYWASYLQRSPVRITQHDYDLIVSRSNDGD